jgi:ATP/maltotriose-dependent transcriptional regulator MalT
VNVAGAEKEEQPLLPEGSSASMLAADAPFVGSATLLIQGYYLLERHDTAGAARAWHQAMALEQRSDTHFVVVALSDLSRQLEWQGQRRAAVTLCQAALVQCADEHGHPLPVAGHFFIRLGDLAYVANHLSEARRYVDAGIELSQKSGTATFAIAGKCALARILCASGQAASACATLQEAHQLALQISAQPAIAECAATATDLQLKCADLSAAEQWAALLGDAGADQPSTYRRGDLTLARLRIAQDRVDEAHAILRVVEQAALEQAQYGRLISIYVLRAIAYRAAPEPGRGTGVSVAGGAAGGARGL